MFVTNGMVFVTNSTYQDFRAKVNGLGQVSAALGRFIVGEGNSCDSEVD